MTDQVLMLGPEQLGFDKWLVARGDINVTAFDKFKKWAEGCDLCIFDPLSSFVGGVDVENDNIMMRTLLDTITNVCVSAGSSCLVLAHQGKPSIGKDGQEHARGSYAIRGASAIEDAATNIFYMRPATRDSIAADNLPEGIKVLDIVKRKYKGDAPDRYRLMRDRDTLCHTLLGNRPFTEVQSFDTKGALDRVLTFNPDLSKTNAVGYIAAVKNLSETTVWNHLTTPKNETRSADR
jgi:hypothetical protein